jgi:hypothetical protein
MPKVKIRDRTVRPRPTKTMLQSKILFVATLSAPGADGGTSPVMAHDQNPHDIANDTKQKMIREALQVHAAEITLANREGFRLSPRPAAYNVAARSKIR